MRPYRLRRLPLNVRPVRPATGSGKTRCFATVRAEAKVKFKSFNEAITRMLTCHSALQDPVELDNITTLSNGVRVATESLPGPFSGVGVYVDAGSRYENEELRGVSHIIDRLAFKVRRGPVRGFTYTRFSLPSAVDEIEDL